MSEHIHVLTVALDRAYNTEDSEAIINTIMMVKGVSDVEPHVVDADTFWAVNQAKSSLHDKLWKVFMEYGT